MRGNRNITRRDRSLLVIQLVDRSLPLHGNPFLGDLVLNQVFFRKSPVGLAEKKRRAEEEEDSERDKSHERVGAVVEIVMEMHKNEITNDKSEIKSQNAK